MQKMRGLLLSEEFIKTNKGWNHKFKKLCPHCSLPLEVTIFVPELPPKPHVSVKGAVKAKATLPKLNIDWKNEKVT